MGILGRGRESALDVHESAPEKENKLRPRAELVDVHPDALRRTQAQIAPPSADELGVRTENVLFPYSWLQNDKKPIFFSKLQPQTIVLSQAR